MDESIRWIILIVIGVVFLIAIAAFLFIFFAKDGTFFEVFSNLFSVGEKYANI